MRDAGIRGYFISIGEYKGLHEHNTKKKMN